MSARIPVRQLPDTEEDLHEHYVHLYQSDDKIYTRRIKGFYQRLRRNIAAPLMLSFFLLPWLTIDNRPAIWLDLSAQKFHVFWLTFWPQDGLLLAWLLMIAALGLFAVTALAGRVWCGFSCPQTIWTQMFIWLEDLCEGDRQQRIKLDERGYDADKIQRKAAKHVLWWALALATGFSFVAYFYGARELLADSLNFTLALDALFWLLFFSAATYLNAGWMREQVCKYMCPYARFQSVMYDQHTRAVAYDSARGDTPTYGPVQVIDGVAQAVRIPRSAKVDHYSAGLGDCIDCSWCVQVCPVDIDIRDGLQPDCINCGLCVDACDQIMDRMDYPRGLIRFASEAELASGNSGVSHSGSSSSGSLVAGSSNSAAHKNKIAAWAASAVASPRLLGYSLALLLLTGLFVQQLAVRTPLDVSISRDRGVHLYRHYSDRIENVYRLRLGNMSRATEQYQVSVEPPYQLRGRDRVTLEEGEVFTLPVRVSLGHAEIVAPQQNFNFRIRNLDSEHPVQVDKAASFIAPEQR